MSSSYSAFARYATVFVLCAAAASAQAQSYRSFPADAKRAELNFSNGVLTLNNKTVEATPGTQIRNELNIIVPPGMVPPNAPVKYQLDPQGKLWRAWVLSKAEAAQPDNARQIKTLPMPITPTDKFSNSGADEPSDSGDPLAGQR